MDNAYYAGDTDGPVPLLGRVFRPRRAKYNNMNDHECLSHHGTNAYAERNSCSCVLCRAAVAEYNRQTVRIRQHPEYISVGG